MTARHKPGAGETLHPLVQEYVTTDRPLVDIVRAMPEPREPLVELIGATYDCLEGKLPYPEFCERAGSFPVEDADPGLAQLLFVGWCAAASKAHRRAEMHALAVRARQLVDKRTPPEIAASIMAIAAAAELQMGNWREHEQMSAEAIALVPRSSPRYPTAVLARALNLAQRGVLGDTEDEVRRLLETAAQGYRSRAALVLFAHFREICRPADARLLLPVLQSDPSYYARISQNTEFATQQLRVMEGVPEGELPLLPLLVAAVGWLMAGRPAEAIEAVRTCIRANPEDFMGADYFLGFSLVRAELACGNAEAARRILRQRRERGQVHPYMDDFLLARVSLLIGDRPSAVQHFAAAWRSAARYRAESRLEFELRLCCEMSPADAAWVAFHAGKLVQGGGAQESVPVAAAQSAAETNALGLARLLGPSEAMERVRRLVAQFAGLDAPVLITGETGTGKELVARALHEAGPRASGPFVAVNCGAIAENLLESELFGHEKGAFTGAVAARRGLFEESGAGTILLDEVGDMPPRLQAALLRVLESGEIRPVGSARSRQIRSRVVAATNADLDALAAEGRFRADLLFRLRRLEIVMPPLRERRADILPLAEHFLAEGRVGGARPVVSGGLRERLLAERWTGNVRELRNTVERMRLLNSDKLDYDEPDLAVAQGGKPRQGERVTVVAPAAASADDELEKLNPKAGFRRLDRLRQLFQRHGKLSRRETASLLGVSHLTATRDLRALCAEGFIEKVMRGRSPRSHYFRLRS